MNKLYLQHHGILGQKWGVRRFQNKDGSLTSAGAKRYNTDVDAKKNDYIKAKNSYSKALDTGRNIPKAKIQYKNAKEDYTDEKIKEKLNRETKISKSRQKYIDDYKRRGFTQEEAEVAAYKRERTKKIIAVTAGLTIAAAAAYVAYRHYEINVDKIIPKNTLINNISTDGSHGVRDAFYASISEKDATKYRGIYGKQLNPFGGSDIFEKKIGVSGDLKVASPKSSINILKDIASKDSSYMKNLEKNLVDNKMFYVSPKQRNVIDKGIKSLKKGKIDNNVYEALNMRLTSHDSDTQKLIDKFYKAMKDGGYDAIKDVNDSKYSGYSSKSAHIIFNNSKVGVSNVRKLTSSEVDENFKKGYNYVNRSALVDTLKKESEFLGAIGAAHMVANYAISEKNRKTDEQKVYEYRKEHPKSELTAKEIIRNIK